MLNNLPLIMVMISSLFLAFYCVDSHKDNIVSMVNMGEKNMEPVSIKREEKLSNSQMESVESVEEVYVEALALEDTNDSNKIVEKTEEKSLSEVVVEDSKPTEVDEQVIVDVKEVEAKVVAPIIEPMPVIEMKSEEVKDEEIEKTVNKQVPSEYSEGYKLDDLEKMIMQELKKGNKD